MAKVNFYLKDANANGESAIRMYFRYGNYTVKISTGELIAVNHWDEKKKRILPKYSKLYASLQSKLDEYKNVISGIYRRLEITGEKINNEVLTSKFNEHFGKSHGIKHTLVTFAEWYVQQVESTKRLSTGYSA